MATTYGYARVSTKDQNEDRQLIALQQAGVERELIYVDKKSGKDFNRPAWKRLRRKLKRGDLLAIRSAGAYGEIMASHYNLRPFAPAVFDGE